MSVKGSGEMAVECGVSQIYPIRTVEKISRHCERVHVRREAHAVAEKDRPVVAISALAAQVVGHEVQVLEALGLALVRARLAREAAAVGRRVDRRAREVIADAAAHGERQVAVAELVAVARAPRGQRGQSLEQLEPRPRRRAAGRRDRLGAKGDGELEDVAAIAVRADDAAALRREARVVRNPLHLAPVQTHVAGRGGAKGAEVVAAQAAVGARQQHRDAGGWRGAGVKLQYVALRVREIRDAGARVDDNGAAHRSVAARRRMLLLARAAALEVKQLDERQRGRKDSTPPTFGE